MTGMIAQQFAFWTAETAMKGRAAQESRPTGPRLSAGHSRTGLQTCPDRPECELLLIPQQFAVWHEPVGHRRRRGAPAACSWPENAAGAPRLRAKTRRLQPECELLLIPSARLPPTLRFGILYRFQMKRRRSSYDPGRYATRGRAAPVAGTRIVPSKRRDLIRLDTHAIRHKALGAYHKAERDLDTLKSQLKRYHAQDVPGFRAWMHRTFGGLRHAPSPAGDSQK